MKRSRPNQIIGISISAHRLALAVVRREGTGCSLRRSFSEALALDPFNAEPELAAREIQSLLATHGIRPGACVVCLPLEMALVHRVQVPAMDERDVADFLQLEAERAFPLGPGELVVADSRQTWGEADRWATLVGVPERALGRLRAVLKRARLRVVGITIGCAAWIDEAAQEPRAALMCEGEGRALVVQAGGGIAAMRSFAMHEEAAGRGQGADGQWARDLKITLRRLPRERLARLEVVEVYGALEGDPRMAGRMEEEGAGLGIELRPHGIDAGCRSVAGRKSDGPPAAMLAAARALAGRPAALEFLRAEPAAWQRAVARWRGRTFMARLAAVAAAVILVAAVAFLLQGRRLARLEARWGAMAGEVAELEQMQDQLRTWRPWLEDDAGSLRILAALTEAFPDEGAVWARGIEVNEQREVECSGLARGNTDCYRMLEALRDVKGVDNLKVVQVSGEKPVQFSFSFEWTGVAGDEQ